MQFPLCDPCKDVTTILLYANFTLRSDSYLTCLLAGSAESPFNEPTAPRNTDDTTVTIS